MSLKGHTDYCATSTRTFCVFTSKLSCTLPLSAAYLPTMLMTTMSIPSCFSDLAYSLNSVNSSVMSFRAPNSNVWGKCNTTHGAHIFYQTYWPSTSFLWENQFWLPVSTQGAQGQVRFWPMGFGDTPELALLGKYHNQEFLLLKCVSGAADGLLSFIKTLIVGSFLAIHIFILTDGRNLSLYTRLS